eukprot:CAMPEP_0181239450 /NCGR_PEP_ID=MMETSP1096-20121128/39941_1 /TAXON_ID=156174 ORGANISM="Chrysochromulina ericina, Strain CCMP281" /NCGR_SAMPLE_ID=MMETSP1096 /ASSEMBLY_ACC=CAM_ASM_000453 /LENGTH=91 /DNA_ID=CAMNT_0023335149 /DNA_START=27 /DNA_END=298 /DNA_ORIENTATION=+
MSDEEEERPGRTERIEKEKPPVDAADGGEADEPVPQEEETASGDLRSKLDRIKGADKGEKGSRPDKGERKVGGTEREKFVEKEKGGGREKR